VKLRIAVLIAGRTSLSGSDGSRGTVPVEFDKTPTAKFVSIGDAEYDLGSSSWLIAGIAVQTNPRVTRTPSDRRPLSSIATALRTAALNFLRQLHPKDDARRSEGVRLDFMPALVAITLAFVVVASVQFLRDLPAGGRGLLLFEKACPIHSAVQRPIRTNETTTHDRLAEIPREGPTPEAAIAAALR
jgi:hypothetical protein